MHELASELEVIVGPGSAKYGSNAVHGLINFSLPRPTETSSRVHVAASSLGRQKIDGLAKFRDELVVGISAQHDNGWRDFTSVDQQKIYLASEFEIGDWNAFAWVSGANLNQETADFLEGPRAYRDRDLAKTNSDPEAFRDARSGRAAIQLVNDSEAIQWRVTPYARWQEMEFRQHFLPFRGIEENGHEAFGLQTRADWTLNDAIEWRFGADLDFSNGYLIETQDLETFGPFPQGVHYDYDVDTDVFAFWTEIDAHITDLSLIHI